MVLNGNRKNKEQDKGNALFFRTMYYLRLAIGYGESHSNRAGYISQDRFYKELESEL